ncbi:uncharacterized protein LOC132401661 [Hypanus sabinus]|uniref:uncharacterized protein LOC132401661 n=1 Tax=Hypanus sabinus TaxID=79690 RepID=UPI0028C3A800|nr:uncharacterized protein LOC132401661 [Hypanus sabinus]
MHRRPSEVLALKGPRQVQTYPPPLQRQHPLADPPGPATGNGGGVHVGGESQRGGRLECCGQTKEGPESCSQTTESRAEGAQKERARDHTASSNLSTSEEEGVGGGQQQSWQRKRRTKPAERRESGESLLATPPKHKHRRRRVAETSSSGNPGAEPCLALCSLKGQQAWETASPQAKNQNCHTQGRMTAVPEPTEGEGLHKGLRREG